VFVTHDESTFNVNDGNRKMDGPILLGLMDEERVLWYQAF
jgi:hypothetical protein